MCFLFLNVNQRLKEAKNRERLLSKLTEKKKQEALVQAQIQAQLQAQAQAQPAAVENLVFSKGEQVERSTREQGAKNKKKKNKSKDVQ